MKLVNMVLEVRSCFDVKITTMKSFFSTLLLHILFETWYKIKFLMIKYFLENKKETDL